MTDFPPPSDTACPIVPPAEPADGAGLSLPVLRFPRSYGADEAGAARA